MTRTARIGLAVLALVTGVLAGADLWFLQHRNEGWAFRPSTYPSVYLPAEHATIVDVRHRDGGVELELSTEVVFPDDLDPRVHGDGRIVRVDPGPGPAEVRWRPRTSPVEVRLSVFTTGQPIVATQDVPLGRFEQRALDESAFSLDTYPPTEVAEAQDLLADAGIVPDQGTPEERWRRVWSFVHDGLAPHAGTPDPDLRRESALTQWKRVTSGESPAYCAQFARTFALFATVAGLKVREVDVLYERSGVVFAAHAFDEVYLPGQGKWIYTDATLGTLGVRAGSSGPWLDAFELGRAHQSGNLEGLVHAHVVDGNLREDPYPGTSEANRRFLNVNGTFVYHRHYRAPASPVAFAHRYLWSPEPTLSHVERGGRYRIQRATMGLSLVFGLGWVVVALRALRRRSASPGSRAGR